MYSKYTDVRRHTLRHMDVLACTAVFQGESPGTFAIKVREAEPFCSRVELQSISSEFMTALLSDS